jgi:uridylate kinase
MSNIFIISLGGSLVVPEDGINFKFIKKFKKLILKKINKKGDKFFIIVGGGKTCRDYNRAIDKIVKTTDENKHWLGIETTRLNAHLLKIIFKDACEQKIILDPTKKIKTDKKIILAGGWKPGWSTDYVAVTIAEKYGLKKIINLTNIDYIFNKDPKKYKDAKPIKEIKWQNYKKLINNKWRPGMNAPFDPIASRKAEKLKIEVNILNGANLKNLENYLKKEKFKGTKIY